MKARPPIPAPTPTPIPAPIAGFWKGRPAPGLSGRWKGAHRLALPAS